MLFNLRSIFFGFLLFLLFSGLVFSVPVVPGESGFGMDTPAGRGGEIYRVVNLNAEGEGSLKECVIAKGSRICVFEVSGTIYLKDYLVINNPNISILGQTAPSPGITIAGAGISVKSHDVLIQHVRIRVGDLSEGPDYEDRDAIQIGSDSVDVYNVVVDHVSASWATDEILSMWSEEMRIYNVTVMNSIFSEALYHSYHPDGPHSTGVLIGKNVERVFLKNNLFAFNNARNPLVRDDSTDVVIVNNFIYGSGTPSKNKINFGSRGKSNVPLRASVVGNVYVNNSADDFGNVVYVDEDGPSSVRIYLGDNVGPVYGEGWDLVVGRKDEKVRAVSAPVWVEGFEALHPSYVQAEVLENSGARPYDRDEVDLRVVNEVKMGSGKIIDSQADVGGWPVFDMNHRKLVIPLDFNEDADGDGYTIFEEWVHRSLYDVESEDIEVVDDKGDLDGKGKDLDLGNSDSLEDESVVLGYFYDYFFFLLGGFVVIMILVFFFVL